MAVSYSDLEGAFRREKEKPTLTNLSEDFYDDSKRLLKDPAASDFTNSINKLIRDIYWLRVNKIIHYAGRNVSDRKLPDNLLPVEEDLYLRLIDAVELSKKKIIDSVLEEESEVEAELGKYLLLKPLPKIVGSDGVEYGPYKQDEVVELPEETAKLLVERGFVEKNPDIQEPE